MDDLTSLLKVTAEQRMATKSHSKTKTKNQRVCVSIAVLQLVKPLAVAPVHPNTSELAQ